MHCFQKVYFNVHYSNNLTAWFRGHNYKATLRIFSTFRFKYLECKIYIFNDNILFSSHDFFGSSKFGLSNTIAWTRDPWAVFCFVSFGQQSLLTFLSEYSLSYNSLKIELPKITLVINKKKKKKKRVSPGLKRFGSFIHIQYIVYLSRDMTQPTKWLCSQRRLRSA